ncbi:MAG: FAD-binding oxidoreductase [Gaiellaceae bacterium MAG52_C11]|nr:FAD-binding oxidoreductase [Candidatus Gaiellasilicea maunaloa]
MADSYWLAEPAAPLRSRRLHGVPEVEIVGGGVTGCSCALALAQTGVRVRLHEARTIAGGASGRNGGFALRGGAMPYDEARTTLGPDRAKALWTLTERGLQSIRALAGDTFRQTGSLRLAADASERAELESEFQALDQDDFAVEWLDDLAPQLERFAGGIRHVPDAAIHPARWVRRLAQHAVDAGAELLEGSQVESLTKLGAATVVIATDGYTNGLVPELDAVIRPIRNQVVVTEPLAKLLFPLPHYARHGSDYWQQTPDRRLVVGGRRDSDATENTGEEALTPLIQKRLEACIVELVGRLPAISHRWAGIFGSSPDGRPLAGPVPGREGLWVAAGYSGHGNVLGFVCGQLVATAIVGAAPSELELFDPARILAKPA